MLCFHSWELLFGILVAAFYGIVVEVLVVLGFFEIFINAIEVDIKDFGLIIQLATDVAG